MKDYLKQSQLNLFKEQEYVQCLGRLFENEMITIYILYLFT